MDNKISSGPKYPHVEVQLVGEDGNALSIISRVRDSLRRAGATPAECSEFCTDAMSGDYDHVLQTCMKWVTTL